MVFYIFYISLLLIAGIEASDEDTRECKPVGKKWIENNTTYWALKYKNETFAYPICKSSSLVKVRCVDGKWEKPLPHCDRITAEQCEPLTPPRYVVKNCTYGSSVDSVCTLRCINNDYQLIGSVSRRCLETLQWSGKETKCNQISGRKKHQVNTNYHQRKPPSVTRTMVGINLCQINNGGCKHICKYSGGNVVCSCYKGYSSSDKECIDIDECVTSNGGCSDICTNVMGSFQCSCSDGYRLDNNRKKCIDINECLEGQHYCRQTCHNTIGSYKCSCNQGYTLKNHYYCEDVDECVTNNGGCTTECINSLGSYYCTCSNGYRWDYSEKKCLDIDECQERRYNCNQNCLNTIGSYTCSCEQGFILYNDYFCRDIDECATNNGNCSTECINTQGSYYCSCPNGYRWEYSEKKCVDIDECQERHYNCNQKCQNTIGSYTCSCEQGFTLYNGYFCEDIDECAFNNGGCSGLCYNTPGSRSCLCNRGYHLDKNGTCIDIDECLERQHYCHQKCLNTVGSYTCTCEDGFMLNYLNQCEDVNECDLSNGGCSDICVNSLGSYSCSCKNGHILDMDGKNCNDINECLHKKHNRCTQKCINTKGSYFCSCEPGYILKNKYECEGCRKNSYKSAQDKSCIECPSNSVTDSEAKTSISDCVCLPGFNGNPSLNSPCNDIDECLSNNFGCSDECVNTPGGVFCSCPLGFQLKGDNKTCEDIDECSLKNGGCQMHCKNTVGSFSCFCSVGYTLNKDKHSCIDINECAKNNGGCSDTCNNFPGGYYCSCPKNYQLNVKGKTCVDIRCPRVAVPHYSVLRCSSKNSTSLITEKQILNSNDENSTNPLYFLVGTTCKVKCHKGYTIMTSDSAIQCLNSGNWNASTPQCIVSHCIPLKIPENGDIYPAVCKEGPISVHQKCYVTCKPGYHISKQEKELKCKNNLTWTTDTPSCEPDNIVPFIFCPNDISVDLVFNESYANVTIPRPETNMEDFEIFPNWIKVEDAISFPGGTTDVRFKVRSSTINTTTECVMTVNVIDKEPPVFLYCPKSFDIDRVGLLGSPVHWDDPFVVDNVGIQSVSTNLEPNSTLSAGIHHVEYTAKDEAGNIAQCLFKINITSVHCGFLSDPENGKANCMEWLMGILCRPSCDPGFERDSIEPKFFACGDSGIWTPSGSISPCFAVEE